jgi:hypothetical protein
MIRRERELRCECWTGRKVVDLDEEQCYHPVKGVLPPGEVIRVYQWPLENTRTPSKSCFYQAACEVNGVSYSARSRNGASNELARVLVAAGIADQPMAVVQKGLKGELTYRSFHRAAKWTYQETETMPLRRMPWVDPAVKRARLAVAFGPKQGVKAETGIPVAIPPLAAE